MNNYRRLIFVFFCLSGFSGLIYESIWTRYLKLFLGHAAYAQVLVPAVFMGGMGVDAWLNELPLTLDKEQEGEIKKLLRSANTEFLYWRVLAQDSNGNVEISEVRRIFISK